MNLKFDPAADALQIRLSDAQVLDSDEVRPGWWSITMLTATSSASNCSA